MNNFLSPVIGILMASISLLGMYFVIDKIVTDRKLDRHQQEWNKIKAAIPVLIRIYYGDFGTVKIKVNSSNIRDEYKRYSNRLIAAEGNTFGGACIPSFGCIIKDRIITLSNSDYANKVTVDDLIDDILKEIGSLNAVISDERGAIGES